MGVSPLQFAKNFARLKSDLPTLLAPDLKLLRLIRFWPDLKPLAGKVSYRTYFDEYIPFIHHLVTEQTLFDFSIDELSALRDILRSLDESNETESTRDLNSHKLRLVTYRLATILCYVGDFEKAIPLCAELSADGDIAFPDSEDLEDLDAFDALRVLSERYKPEHPALGNILKDIYECWEGERSCLNHDRAWCLFVEKNQIGQATRGRMRTLHGTVELRAPLKKDGDAPDTVTFDNQVKSPDDPFIGVVYDSLTAVRNLLKKTRFSGKADGSYRAFFSIPESRQTFTGDSIGLAAGLVAYTQLLKTEIMRQERFVASEVAFTGGLDADGRLLPIDKDTLGVKIERAFFSPVKYLALAEECLADAGEYLNSLSRKYPRRRLLLIGHERLTDVIENHNVVRSQKVCIGEFVVRKAAKYSRATKVQVPIMLILLYFFLCLIYPKAWVFFDWNPQYVKFNASSTGFVAMNKDSIPLWSVEYECNSIDTTSSWRIGDLNGDGRNEVAFVPGASKTLRCGSNANLFVYDDDGTLLFQRYCAKDDEYPGTQPPCGVKPVVVEKVGDRSIIITGATRSFPARLYLMFWNHEGDLLGWYINAGYSGAFGSNFLRYSDSQFVFLGYNNRMECACLYVLEPYSSYGVSPPYTDPGYNLDNVKRGNQIYYVLFPRSDLNRAVFADYNSPGGLFLESDGRFRADVFERDAKSAALSYYLDSSFRVVNVSYDDCFRPCRDSLVAEGKLSAINWSTYCNNLRDSLTYWRESGWVTEGQRRKSEQKAK